MNIYNMLL